MSRLFQMITKLMLRNNKFQICFDLESLLTDKRDLVQNLFDRVDRAVEPHDGMRNLT